MHAQVTIGSGIEPVLGALLDMKQHAPDLNNVTSTMGLGMPRVNLTDLYDITKDISEVTATNKDAHIGLMVYNINQCLTDTQGNTHGQGLYVWDGNQWVSLKHEELSAEVQKFTDPRDQKEYLYRSFGTNAGVWMLENLRYIPSATDGYTAYSHSLTVASTDNKEKYYCYPVNGTYNTSSPQPPASWLPREGLLYNWYAATNNENTATTDQAGIPLPANIQGICPAGWHIPSDYEWTLLEQEIYNNPQKYSSYTGSNQFNPTSWNSAWNTHSATAQLRGSSNGSGHGKAMKAACPLPGGGAYSDPVGLGSSFSPEQGGFSALLTGYPESNGENDNFYQGAYFISASHYYAFNSSTQEDEVGFWYRGLGYYTDTYEIYSAQVRYHHSANSNFFSLRCKKD